MNNLSIKSTNNKFNLSFPAESALNCDLTRDAIKSYFINEWAYNDFIESLERDILNLAHNTVFSNLYHLDGQNIISSVFVKYKYTLAADIVSLCITHHITKEDTHF